MSHTYRITAGKPGLPEGSEPVRCTFEITNHDDIVPLIEWLEALLCF